MSQPTDDEVLDEIRGPFHMVAHVSVGTAPDGGDDFLITKKAFNEYAESLATHYAKKLELAELKARRDELAHAYPTIYEDVATDLGTETSGMYKSQDDRLAELDAQIKEREAA